MAVDLSKWPLLVFVERVDRWRKSADSPSFWETMVEHVLWAQQLRDEAKGLIIWMELNGLEKQAAELEEKLSDFRRATWEFEQACEGVYPPEDAACRERKEVIVDSASRLSGVAEDLNDEVDETVWEGYGDA